MAQQGELFPKAEVTIRLDGSRGEPRLWVRRIVLWEKPGEIIRDIPLRRGLNIIWSPDPGAKQAELGLDAGSGHGAGKTLFCRLLRYCLGEDTFSNDEQRRSIVELLPAGLVGAEVIMNGKPWAVIRPIGQTRKHVAREGATLEELAPMKEPGGSIEPLLDAFRSQLFPKGIESYLPSERQNAAWLFALAWMSRDQECRFDHILDWRHKRADSGSIAVGPTKEQLLIVVRAFLGIIEQEEMRLKGERVNLSETKRSLERDVAYYQRQSEQLRAGLVQALAVDAETEVGGELGAGLFREKAESKLKGSEQQDNPEDIASLSSHRQEREGLLKEIAVLESEIKKFNSTKQIHDEQLKVIRGERSNLDAAALKAQLGPVCPVCSVPIDEALAEGCSLSHHSWDPGDVSDEKQRLATQTAAHNEAISRIRALTAEHTTQFEKLGHQEAKLTAEIDELVNKIEDARNRRRQQWFSAKQLVEQVSALERASASIADAKKSLEGLAGRDNELADLEAKLRNHHSDTLSRMEELFSYVCKGLLGNRVRASLVLSGQGLQADVEVGGMAMESLKAIAFDLAALLMSIEGHSMLPAFLVHDSPREADLGEAIYHRLFRLVCSLERLGDDPPFQYIITTTSRPPDDFCQMPFLVAELQGSKAGERLLRRDLGGLTN
jgi:ferritin